MVLLPALVLGAEVESSRVLEIGRQDDGLVAGLTGKLDTEVPGIECDKDEVQVLIREVFARECIESVDRIPKGSSVAYMLPSESRQARCK